MLAKMPLKGPIFAYGALALALAAGGRWAARQATILESDAKVPDLGIRPPRR